MKASLESTAKLQLPLLSAVVVPNELDPANSSTVLPASDVPVKVGVVSFVMLSVLDLPVSEASTTTGSGGGGSGGGAPGRGDSSAAPVAVSVETVPTMKVRSFNV